MVVYYQKWAHAIRLAINLMVEYTVLLSYFIFITLYKKNNGVVPVLAVVAGGCCHNVKKGRQLRITQNCPSVYGV